MTVRLRGDLHCVVTSDSTRQDVTIIDELGGRYLRVSPPQWRQLKQLQDESAPTCPPQLLQSAAAAGLLHGTSPSGRSPTSARNRSHLNPWAIRLPGISVDPLARWLAQRTDWLFSPRSVVLWGLVVLTAALLVPTQWERFQRNLPALHTFFSQGNLLLLVGTLWSTKAIHELAHAIVCRRMGARCGEIGILLLCGTPCPYCDVTDSWRIPSAARRAAIMLAGIYVEFILAALAFFVWWFTEPGTLHLAALNVMIVCSVSTLLFNLNPLMRYDGYYVLADAVGSHHLREEAAHAFRQCVVRPLAGPTTADESPRMLRAWLLSIYHLAASAYRLVVSVLIAVWIWHLADAIAIPTVGSVAATGMLLAIPLASVRRWLGLLGGRGTWQRVPLLRRLLLAGSLAALVCGVLFLPLRRTQLAHGQIDVANATVVYAPETARVREVRVGFGEPVSEGDVLATLENVELERQWLELSGKRQTLELQIQQLRLQAIEETSLLEQLDTQLATLQAITEQAERLRGRIARMTVTAPTSGVLLPVAGHFSRDDSTAQNTTALAARTAAAMPRSATHVSPVSSQPSLRHELYELQGSWVGKHRAWCRIADPRQREVTVEIDSELRSSVQVGDTIRVRCQQSPAIVLDVQIDSISTLHQPHRDFRGRQNRFRVACTIPPELTGRWQIGSSVTAQLELPPRSLAHRWKRWWQETLRVG